MGTSAAEPFTIDAALQVAHEACAEQGVPVEGAELIRLGENAMFRLPVANTVVRVARSAAALAKVRKEVDVAQWLEHADFPAVRLVAELPQAELVSGYPVTWWRWVENTGEEATTGQLGSLLRKFHQIQAPPP